MKCKIPEISWHNRDPVLSVDIQPRKGDDGVYRLASGGTDSHVLIWYMQLTADGSDIELDLAADLTRHQRAVNVVKWSPSGELLASGDDESVVFIWKQKPDSETLNILDAANDQDKEIWISMKVLRGHIEDVYDLSWAPNSQFLVSGSVDNTAMIWDVHKGKSLAILDDHKGFVQGVAWDPKNQYIATLSTDRYLRIFDIQTKRVLHRTGKGTLPVPAGDDLHGRRVRYFHDDTLQTFFRRLSFTPDGKLLLVPAGVTDYEGVTHPLHTTYVFSRYGLRQPAIMLPCPDQYTVAVRCCPLLYRLRPHNPQSNPPVVPLPYRMIFAVATRSSVYFYDTQQHQPFALISNIHYTRLTDITWSSDGRFVVVSSTDGFCSLITFEEDELGVVYEEMDAVLGAALAHEALPPATKAKLKKQKENETQPPAEPRKPSTDDVRGAGSKPREPLQEKANKAGGSEKTGGTATPIAIKRKPGVDTEKAPEKASSGAQPAEEDTKDAAKTAPTAPTGERTPQRAAVQMAVAKLPLPVDIIIDKEILSSDEKFESPEKKSRPATPISVRRHPRTPNSSSSTALGHTPSTSTSTTASATTAATPNAKLAKSLRPELEAQSPCSSLKAGAKVSSPRNAAKRATPIAVRRTPRALITGPSQVVDTPTVVEEAMDAWPLPADDADGAPQEAVAAAASAKDQSARSVVDASNGCTEDIRLVYEDTADTQTNDGFAELKEAPPPTAAQADVPAKPAQFPAALCTPKQRNKAEPAPEPEAEPEAEADAQPSPAAKSSTNKTPRRVALKTISTPKSKKKLLD